jgi:hypothetical protein
MFNEVPMKQLLIISFLLFLCLGGEVAAQHDDAPDGARQRLSELRRMKMIEALDLNEEQAIRLTVREKDFRQQEEDTQKERESILKVLRSQISENSDPANVQATIMKLENLGVESVKRKHAFLLSLSDFLSMQQIGKLVVFEHQFAHQIRKILGNSRRPPPPRR